MTKIPHDNRSLDFGSAFAVQDPETLKILREPFDLSCVHNDSIIDEFLHLYDKWIRSSQCNTIIGLDQFQYKCYSNGTTESFDKFYLRNHNRRFRCFKGEYMYHRLAWRPGFDWAWIEDADIAENDAVIISLPFADTGGKHPQYHEILRRCNELHVPVLIDCAYFGICRNIEFDFAYSCITDITFSLSKTFPLAYAKIGMRYTRADDDDTMFVYNKINYCNKVGASLGIKFLENFSPDYISSKYIHKQIEYCNILNVAPSNTVLFGIGGPDWDLYNRGGPTNRLSFHKQFIKGLDYARTE
jgi:hypothetical protein